MDLRARHGSITNLFLTGPRGVGKTTLLFDALSAYLPRRAAGPPSTACFESPSTRTAWPGAGGFVVKRVYRKGQRAAFDLVDLGTGERAAVASFPRADRPQVNPDAFTRIGVPAIERALAESRIVVMDELGRFELGAPAFLDAVLKALGSRVPVVGVLKMESNSFLDAIRKRPDTVCIRIARGQDPCSEGKAAFLAALAQLLEKGEISPAAR